ncbi:MAG: AMP-binding protein, partial [Acidimicrobiales bacterium]
MPDTEIMSLADATRALISPGQMFEMEEVSISDIPTRIWKHCPADLRVILELSRGHGGKDFLVYEDERITFERHYRTAAAIARALADRFGLTKGERVSIAMRNLPEWATTFWGAAAAGAILVPLNAWWTGAELRFGLGDSGSSVVVVDAERLERIAPYLGELPDLRGVVVTSEDRAEVPRVADSKVPIVSYRELVGDPAADITLPDVELNPEDDVTIFYTSGTTGTPKGAVGTHRNMCTNLMSLYFVNARASMRGAN